MLKKTAWLLLILVFVFSFVSAKDRKMETHGKSPVQYEKAKIVKWDRSIQGVTSISWDFDGAFPPAGWDNDGWAQTGNNTRGGAGCAYCDETVANPGTDNYSDRYHNDLYSPIFEVPNPYMKGVKLDFYANFDYPEEDELIVWIQAWKNGVYWGEYSALVLSGNNGRYRKYSVNWVDVFDYETVKQITAVRFCFCHQWMGTGNGAAGLGAFIDDVKLMFHYWDPVDADFEAMPIAGKMPLDVQFHNKCSGNPNHFVWEYGDGLEDYLRGGWPDPPNPMHTYAMDGEFHVKFTAWNNVMMDEMMIPYLIYADPDYELLDLEVVDAGDTYPDEGWDNAIDHDVYGYGSRVAAVRDDAWAIFQFADSTAKAIYKIRLLTDTADDHLYITNVVKKYELTFSTDGVTFDQAIMAESDKRNGEWDMIDIEELTGEPIVAQWVKLKLLEPRGGGQWCEFGEFQLFGTSRSAAMAAKENAFEVVAVELPKQFKLNPNFPNPFNPTTNIRFDLPESADIQLSIYNIQGQLVEQLASGNYNAGFHTITWDAQNVAGGMYFYKLLVRTDTEAFDFTNKMLLMK